MKSSNSQAEHFCYFLFYIWILLPFSYFLWVWTIYSWIVRSKLSKRNEVLEFRLCWLTWFKCTQISRQIRFLILFSLKTISFHGSIKIDNFIVTVHQNNIVAAVEISISLLNVQWNSYLNRKSKTHILLRLMTPWIFEFSLKIWGNHPK